MCSNLLNEFYNKMEIKIPNQFMYIEQNKDFQFSNRNVSLSKNLLIKVLSVIINSTYLITSICQISLRMLGIAGLILKT
jgi:hypothetical protein